MRHFNVSIILLHVLEAFKMQRQNHRQFLDTHSLLCLLVATTIVTLKLIVAAKRFRIAEASQAMCYACILVNINLQIEKMFILTANRFAVKASRLARQNSLENFMHPSWFRCCSRIVASGRCWWGRSTRSAATIAVSRCTCTAALLLTTAASSINRLTAFGQNYFIYMVDKKV